MTTILYDWPNFCTEGPKKCFCEGDMKQTCCSRMLLKKSDFYEKFQ